MNITEDDDGNFFMEFNRYEAEILSAFAGNVSGDPTGPRRTTDILYYLLMSLGVRADASKWWPQTFSFKPDPPSVREYVTPKEQTIAVKMVAELATKPCYKMVYQDDTRIRCVLTPGHPGLCSEVK